MPMDGGHLLVEGLKREGVKVVFGLAGFHVSPIFNACRDAGIRLIDVRHEQAASHAADGWARATGEPGVAIVTAGPGVTNTVTGLAVAYQANVPMLLIGGKEPFMYLGQGALQAMDTAGLVRTVTKAQYTVYDVKRTPEYVSMAYREATSGVPGPVYLEVPFDHLMKPENEQYVWFPKNYRTKVRTVSEPAYIQQACDHIQASKRPMIIAGGTVRWSHAEKELIELAEKIEAPIFLNGMGRGSVPPDHPNSFSLSRGNVLAKTDLVLLIGTPMDFRLGYGKQKWNKDAKVIQIERIPELIAKNRDVDLGLCGDAGLNIKAIYDELAKRNYKADRGGYLQEIRADEDKRWQKMMPAMQATNSPIIHHRMCKEIADFIDEDTIVIGDGGDIVAIGSKIIKIRKPGHWMDPGPLGCLGVGTGYALAAQAAHPDKRVLLLNGDGTWGMNGMELETALRHDLPIVCVVGNDAGWGQIRTPHKMVYGKDKLVSTELAYTRYDKIVEAMGGHGEFCDKPEQIRPALERAFAAKKAACVNIILDKEGLEKFEGMKGYAF
ncbi:MAG: thiamine pyrophosphate-binding protein [Bdellovibrionota bacterium]